MRSRKSAGGHGDTGENRTGSRVLVRGRWKVWETRCGGEERQIAKRFGEECRGSPPGGQLIRCGRMTAKTVKVLWDEWRDVRI